jgi:SAM-dependent methyltransferase
MTTTTARYAIRGGAPGRERLRVLAGTMRQSTGALFDRLGLGAGLRALDVGCGGGDVTFELARRAGPGGGALGIDIDETKLELARREAASLGLENAAFRTLDISRQRPEGAFDVVYIRFVLTHLADPAGALVTCLGALRPGGLLVVEDIDFAGLFAWPETQAFRRYCALYESVVRHRGGDPNIGPRLPVLLADAGCEQVGLQIVQPAGQKGDVKLINPLTLEQIADSVLHDGLASREELDTLVEELYRFAADPRTVTGLARVFQVWGRRPGGEQL